LTGATAGVLGWDSSVEDRWVRVLRSSESFGVAGVALLDGVVVDPVPC